MSFGDSHGALRWLNENHISYSSNHFDMITDEKRILYKFFGLPNSYLKVWNCETLTYYSEQLLKKGQLPQAYKDVEDDPHQMGGNFIIELDQSKDNSNMEQNETFRVVYTYKSKNPPDRPSSADLLRFLEQNQK